MLRVDESSVAADCQSLLVKSANPEVHLTLEQWQRLAAEFPLHEATRRSLVEHLMRWGRLVDADAEARSMCQHRTLFATAKTLLAEIEWLRNRECEARRHLEDAARVSPGNTSVLAAMCKYFFQAGMWDDAEIALREWERREPHNEVALCNLAMVLEQRGSDAEASDRYRRVLALNPNNRLAQRRLTTCS